MFNVWYYTWASLGLHAFFNGCILIKDLHSPQQQVPHLLPQVCDSTFAFIGFFSRLELVTWVITLFCLECSGNSMLHWKSCQLREWLPISFLFPSIFPPRKAMGTLGLSLLGFLFFSCCCWLCFCFCFFFLCQNDSEQFKILSNWNFTISCNLLTLLPLKRVAEFLNIML